MNDLLAYNRPMTAIDWIVDAVITAGAFGFGCLQLVLAVNLIVPDEFMRSMLGINYVTPTGWAILVVALCSVPLIVRRRFPWVALIATCVLWAVCQTFLGSISLSIISMLLALFTLAYERPRNHTFVGTILVVAVAIIGASMSTTWTFTALTFIQNLAFIAAAALAGYALHAHEEYLHAVEEQLAEVERSRESEAERRVEEERVRIAQEVHDITAHSISAVSIQAAAAERLIDTDPEAAKQAIATVRQTSKEALEEMRAMIGLLRSGDVNAPQTPTEGTDRMKDLVEYLDNAHISCTLDETNFDKSAVPTYIDVAIYRIAREACTNIVRHAHARTCRITLGIAEGADAYANASEQVSGNTSIHNASDDHSTESASASDNETGNTSAPDNEKTPSQDQEVLSWPASTLHKYDPRANESTTSNTKETSPSSAYNMVFLTIEDDGCGISDKTIAGNGISGMRERVRALNGNLTMSRSVMGGLLISVTIPLPDLHTAKKA